MFQLKTLLLFGISFCASVAISQDTPAQSASLQGTSQKKNIDSISNYIRNNFYQNNFDIVIANGPKAIEIAEQSKDTNAIFQLSSLLGNSFLKIDDTAKAKLFFSKTIEKAKEYQSDYCTITAMIDLANLHFIQEEIKEARALYKDALHLAEKTQNKSHLFILNYNIAESYLNDDMVSEASNHITALNTYIKALNPISFKAVAQIITGRFLFQKKENTRAISYLERGLDLAHEAQYTDAIIEGNEWYGKALSSRGNYKSALARMLIVDSLKSEKYKTDKIEAIESITAKYKLNQYEKELEAQAMANEYNQKAAKREMRILAIKIASGILLFFSIILLLSYLKRRKLFRDLVIKSKQYLEEKRKTEALAKAKTKLFSAITHELRTPMYGIIGVASLMMKDKNIHGHKENLSSLKFSADHLLALINNVLLLNKIDSNKKNALESTSFDLREMINNIIKSSKYINKDSPNTYVTTIDDTIPYQIQGDAVKISQVLINLIGNAAKFTQDGTIRIRVDRRPTNENIIRLVFHIEDTGIGMSEERQKDIFDEFSHTAYTSGYQGSGLGLPIVKKILEQHDSKIQLESALGKGTHVQFTIDYLEAPPVAIAATLITSFPATKLEIAKNSDTNFSKDTSDGDHLILKSEHILIVDDNKINQLVTSKTLEGFGATTTCASDGKEAIAIMKSKDVAFNLVLMDINMPGMNGFETTQAIREFNQLTPIIALSAVELEKLMLEDVSNIMDDYIIKPYENKAFIETITAHLNKQRSA